jgi:hypothetical protein
LKGQIVIKAGMVTKYSHTEHRVESVFKVITKVLRLHRKVTNARIMLEACIAGHFTQFVVSLNNISGLVMCSLVDQKKITVA